MTTSVPAVHEAGHAWAYWRHGLPLRYVTLRPREPGVLGVCRPWRTRQVPASAMAYIASAGPVAQAVGARENDDGTHASWTAYLTEAVAHGGRHDLDLARSVLESRSATRQVWDDVERDWEAVLRVAADLTERRTVAGREVFALLERTLSRPSPSRPPSSPS